jgi:hypothetical protein
VFQNGKNGARWSRRIGIFRWEVKIARKEDENGTASQDNVFPYDHIISVIGKHSYPSINLEQRDYMS